MKSFFNSLYTITKPQKKLKATLSAVELAMNLLLSSQAMKHRVESAYHQFKTTNLANTTVTSNKVKDFTRRLLFCSNLYDASGMI